MRTAPGEVLRGVRGAPKYLAERIINSKAALEGERKQVTVLFADLKGSMELLADRDPEEAREILDPVLELMIEAIHHYEGTVNQVEWGSMATWPEGRPPNDFILDGRCATYFPLSSTRDSQGISSGGLYGTVAAVGGSGRRACAAGGRARPGSGTERGSHRPL